ncbi:MAG TPA: hypothetical protein VJ863_02345, partial [Sphaerochaeta sp.]|nr:hypothetical protein [Sphaerochaeta sp.]
MMDYSSILVPLVTLIISLALVFDLARFRFSRKKLALIIVIELCVLVLISSIVLMVGGLAVYAKWYVLIMVVPAFATFLYTSKYRDARVLFTVVTTIFLSFFISTPAMWFARFYDNGYGPYNLARIVLFALIFLFIHTVFRKYYLLSQEEITKGWGIFSILPILGSVVLYYSFMQYGQKSTYIEVLYVVSATTILMASVYIVIFYMFQQLHEKYMMQEQRRMLAMQNKAQLDQHILFREA